MNAATPKARSASVYALSKTLDLLVIDDGTLWFQRNHREPYVLSASEGKKLQQLAQPGMIIASSEVTRG